MAGKRFNSSGDSRRNYSSRGRKLKYSQELIEEQNSVDEDADISSEETREIGDAIYSSSSKNKKPDKKRSKKTITISFVCLFLAIVFLVSGVCAIYFGNLLSLYTYSGTTSTSSNASSTGKSSPVAAQQKYADPEKIGDLYHDDAILNILLMGVDDYQENDIGRTDSMMLVSIDRRHKQLKITSFMRDMYLQLSDGWAPNRINVAYSLGGPQCLVNTIEKNFNVDIDKYVLIEYDVFEKLIDSLGGVEVNLTADEAAVINDMAPVPGSYAVEGSNTLTGSQARYYARIRHIGDGDFERTERQRIIFSSLINKFKNSDLITISKLGNQVVSEVSSDLTQEDIVNIITNATTYMNYQLLQNRIPSDEMFSYDSVYISGDQASVLTIDSAWNAIYTNEFIYGDDFPELAATLKANKYKLASDNNTN